MDALLHSITITNALPCLADPVLIRVWADFSDDISGIMPYLNAVVPGIIYNPNGLSVTIKRGGRLITAYAGQIAIGKLADINDAHRTLEWFKDLVNDTFAKKDKITPVYERRKTLSAVDIYKLLPGENCGKCGVPTCLAFIAQILSGDFNIMKCGPLFGAEFREKRRELLRILRAAGYEVPGKFL